MSDLFWIALELSIPKIGFNIKLTLAVKNSKTRLNLTELRNMTTLF